MLEKKMRDWISKISMYIIIHFVIVRKEISQNEGKENFLKSFPQLPDTFYTEI